MSKFGIGRTATTIAPSQIDDGSTSITYHRTVVVCYSGSFIRLNSGGYETVTTKRRMNEASKTLSLGYEVFQVDFSWFVRWRDQIYTFQDGITLDRQSGAVRDHYGMILHPLSAMDAAKVWR